MYDSTRDDEWRLRDAGRLIAMHLRFSASRCEPTNETLMLTLTTVCKELNIRPWFDVPRAIWYIIHHTGICIVPSYLNTVSAYLDLSTLPKESREYCTVCTDRTILIFTLLVQPVQGTISAAWNDSVTNNAMMLYSPPSSPYPLTFQPYTARHILARVTVTRCIHCWFAASHRGSTFQILLIILCAPEADGGFVSGSSGHCPAR